MCLRSALFLSSLYICVFLTNLSCALKERNTCNFIDRLHRLLFFTLYVFYSVSIWQLRSRQQSFCLIKVSLFNECVIICSSIQTGGLGGLKPNTVILGWPYGWRQSEDHDKTWHVFLQTVRNVAAARMALLVPKGINFFPDTSEKVNLLARCWRFLTATFAYQSHL